MKGTSYDQDVRFADKTKRMLQNSQWPDKYDIKIDLEKVDIDLIKVWIQKRIFRLLGEEDDIVSGTVIGLLDNYIDNQQKPNAKKMHIDLSGFLKQKTLTFMSELWDLLDDAQKSSNGIPSILIEQKRKQQAQERKKLSELRKRNERYQNKKFDRVISRHLPSRRDDYNMSRNQRNQRNQRGNRSRQRQESRSVDRRQQRDQKLKKQRKNKDMSRSRDHKSSKKSDKSSKDRKRSGRYEQKKKNRKRSYDSDSDSDRKRSRSKSSSKSQKGAEKKKTIEDHKSDNKVKIEVEKELRQRKNDNKKKHQKKRHETSSSSQSKSSSDSSSVVSSSSKEESNSAEISVSM